MSMKKMLATPVKNTLMTLLVFVALYVILFVAKVFLERLYFAECEGVIVCMNAIGRNVVYTVLSDLAFVSRVCIELCFIFLATQLISRIFYRK